VAKTKKLAENWNLTETEFIGKCLGMVEISLEKESDTISVDVSMALIQRKLRLWQMPCGIASKCA
jgi:hypothetical protein